MDPLAAGATIPQGFPTLVVDARTSFGPSHWPSPHRHTFDLAPDLDRHDLAPHAQTHAQVDPAPVEDTLLLLEDMPDPVEDMPDPVEDMPDPVEDTVPATEDAPCLAEETAPAVEDMSRTVEDNAHAIEDPPLLVQLHRRPADARICCLADLAFSSASV